MTGARYIPNEESGVPAAPTIERKTLYIAQIQWREPWKKPYTQGLDCCETVTASSPLDFREKIAHWRSAKGGCERFNIDCWSEDLRKANGHWRTDAKHSLNSDGSAP